MAVILAAKNAEYITMLPYWNEARRMWWSQLPGHSTVNCQNNTLGVNSAALLYSSAFSGNIRGISFSWRCIMYLLLVSNNYLLFITTSNRADGSNIKFSKLPVATLPLPWILFGRSLDIILAETSSLKKRSLTTSNYFLSERSQRSPVYYKIFSEALNKLLA